MTMSAATRPTPQPKPKGSGGWLRRISPFLFAHKRNVALAFGVAVVGQAVTALAPLISKTIIDDVIVANRRPLAPWLGMLVASGLFGFAMSFVRRYAGGRVALDVQFDLRNAVYERLQRLDFASHDKMQTGQLVSRASSDTALIQGLLSFLPIMLGNVVLLVVALVVMFVLSPQLTLVALLAIPAMLFVAMRLRKTIFPASWDAQQRAAEVAGVVDEAVTGVRVVKGFGQETARARRPRGRGSRPLPVTGATRPAHRPLHADHAVDPGARTGRGARLRRVARASTATCRSAHCSRSRRTSCSWSAPVRMFAMLLALGQQARAGAERILDILDANPLITEQPDAPGLVRGEGRVVLRQRHLRLHGQRSGATRLHPRRRAGRNGGAGRRQRLGQVDRGPAASPLLRRRRRDHHDRRRRRPRRHARFTAQKRRRGLRRPVPVLRFPASQHRLRRTRRHRRRDRSGRPRRRSRHVHPRLARTATTPSSANAD